MNAIILAAGLGSRLGMFGENTPKGMITISGKTLLERQIEILHNCGINDITIVTGHNSKLIKYPNIHYIENPNYSTTNMNESLFCARKKFDDSILVSYSDIIYEQKVIEQLLKSKSDFSIGIRFDWKESYENRTQHPLSEAENVIVENNKIIFLRKNLSTCTQNQKIGEFLGLMKLTKKGINQLLNKYIELKNNNTKNFHSSESLEKAYLTDMLQEMVDSGSTLYPVILSDLWFEIDTEQDIERAEKLL
jgi:L-glutamine-phosphate cytidylyltransferase